MSLMINKQVTLTISNDNRTTTLSNPITVYRGDGNINIELTLAQQVYQFGRPITRIITLQDDIINVNVDVVRPEGNSYFTLDTVEMVDNTFCITLTKEWLDEIEEVGTYYFQVNTFDTTGNQATLPSFPVEVLPRLIDSVSTVRIGDLIKSGAIGSDVSYVTHVAGQAIEIPYWAIGEAVTVERMNEQLDIIKANDTRINVAMTRAEDLLETTEQIQNEYKAEIEKLFNNTIFYRIVE